MAWPRNTAAGVSLTVVFILAAWAAGAAAGTPPHAVALMYHHVDTGTPGSTSVSPEVFRSHLDHLAGHGFQVLDLAEVIAKLATGGDLPDRAVALTFDDGYRSVYETAFPLLAERGWPFTVFVCPEDIDRRRGRVVTWDQLREMAAAGATVANHGLRHDSLLGRGADETDQAWAARVRAELNAAQARLAEEIGPPPALLAYPYGEFDAALQAIVRDLGWSAVGQQSGAMGELSDPTALPRFPMAGSFASMENFPVKASCLPLPVLAAESAGPVLPAGLGVVKPRPVLRLTLGEGDYRAGQLAAYASGQDRADLTWVDEEARILEVRAREPLGPGRSRYNVTAPATDGRRYYWFSYTWIVGGDHKD